MTTWKIPTDTPTTTEQAVLDYEDKLLAQLANASFERSATSGSAAPPPAAPEPAPVAPLPVHAVDPDEQAVHAALQAGTIPTFADEPSAAPPPPPQPLDVNAEVEAYRAFLKILQEHADPNSAMTFLDPEAYAKGLI